MRPSIVTLQFGAKRTGKTQATLDIIADFARAGKRVLIFDIGNQPEYDLFEDITIEQLPYFREITVAKCRQPDRIEEFFEAVNSNIRNTLLILEDATSYMGGNLPKSIQRVLLNSRNANNDILVNLHSIAEPAPFLWRHSEVIILRRTGDDAYNLPKKVRNPEQIQAAMIAVARENARLYPAGTPQLAYRKLDLNE